MPPGYDMESPAATADDLRQVLEQFLAGRVHLDLLLATVHRVLHDDPDAAHAIQAHADGALREGELPESVWEKITAEGKFP